MCMCVTDLNGTISPPFWSVLFDLNENSGESGTACEGAVRNRD